ncbi:cysteine-rich receptor-like protein kinase 34 [Miscanthus floridulus]|uniref:cysteine-rich receptor-like protein kinase 34 n=1 Tax=Miscanthus floridulus TaxID=154761 RepID=UPI003459B8AF
MTAAWWYVDNHYDIDNSSSKEEDIEYFESEQLNLVVVRAATNNFSDENKLGEGGFGEVFKGTLQDGKEIAVKRLSQNSSQGFHELKNELVLAAKLKHRNLVELLGVCLQDEKLIIYEYMPNRSLDTFLLDPGRRQQLEWSKRFVIICGIARGLLYLHEESRMKVIHRDLKPSNVLLDADMNPKISEFGIARAFHRDQSRDITRRPVGTLGYMSPEYAYWGHVSSKSDMFSFGVIVLEMVTGRRNNSAYDSEIDSVSVLSHVWDKWRTGSTSDVVDPLLAESGYPETEVVNCIEVGLLCVQENPSDRPDASAVVLMLSSPTSTSDDRRAPSRPAFAFSSGFTAAASGGPTAGSWSSDSVLIGDQQRSTATVSENEVSISELQPR